MRLLLAVLLLTLAVPTMADKNRRPENRNQAIDAGGTGGQRKSHSLLLQPRIIPGRALSLTALSVAVRG
jgi:hypothetical protein